MFKRVLAILAVVILLLSLGILSAMANPDNAETALAKARHVLEEKVIGRPGITGIAHSETEGKIIVLMETAAAAKGVPASFLGFPVEKRVTGQFKALSVQVAPAIATRTDAVRPLVGGTSLSAYVAGVSYAGTLGLVTYGDQKILSNAHVIAMDPRTAKFLPLGTPILQPGSFDGGTLANRVGVLQKYMDIKFNSPKANNYADAAIATLEVAGQSGVQFAETSNYTISGTTTVAVGDTVRKSGRTTAVTTSTVTATNATVWVKYTSSKLAVFKDQLLVAQPFIQAGDSGSAVDKDGAFVGLVFAGSNTDAVVSKAAYILTGLGISVGP